MNRQKEKNKSSKSKEKENLSIKIQCENFQCLELSKFPCSECQLTYYCSTKCQRENRNRHASICQDMIALTQLAKYIQFHHRLFGRLPLFSKFEITVNKATNLNQTHLILDGTSDRPDFRVKDQLQTKETDYLEYLIFQKKFSRNLARRFIATKDQNILHALFLTLVEAFLSTKNRQKTTETSSETEGSFHFMAVRGDWMESFSELDVQYTQDSIKKTSSKKYKSNDSKLKNIILIKRNTNLSQTEDILVEFAHHHFPQEASTFHLTSPEFTKFVAQFPQFPKFSLSVTQSCLESHPHCFLTNNSELYLLNLTADCFWNRTREKKKNFYRLERVFLTRNLDLDEEPFQLIDVKHQVLMELRSLDHLGGVIKSFTEENRHFYFEMLGQLCSPQIISLAKQEPDLPQKNKCDLSTTTTTIEKKNKEIINFVSPTKLTSDLERTNNQSNEVKIDWLSPPTFNDFQKYHIPTIPKIQVEDKINIQRPILKQVPRKKKKKKKTFRICSPSIQKCEKCEKENRKSKTRSQWIGTRYCRETDLTRDVVNAKDVDAWGVAHLQRILKLNKIKL